MTSDEQDFADDASGPIASRAWSANDPDTVLIARRIASIALPRVLQIGALDGRTTRVLAEAAASRGGTVVAIDPMRWDGEDEGLARRHAARARPRHGALDRNLGGNSHEASFWRNVGARAECVTLFRRPSTSVAMIASEEPSLAAFDVMLLDGDHAYHVVRSDLAEWASRVRPGGAVYVRDAAPELAGLQRALAEHAALHDVAVQHPRGGSLALMDVELRVPTYRGPRLVPPRTHR